MAKQVADREDGCAVEFDNKRWEAKLRSRLKDCRFPASTEIGIGGTPECATITMKTKGLDANMQADAAAFEAWALALLFHCDVRSVQIGFDSGEATAERHYERFLYRLQRFSELFPDRVAVNVPARLSKALDPSIKRFLNQPNPRKNPPEADSRERILAASATASESQLEKALEISGAFQRRFGLGRDKVMRQWPVGLFSDRVADDYQIFTGGKSAIDLIGMRGDTLVLFELKKNGNRKAGALSELLFYASVMRDAIKGTFEFESDGAKVNCAIAPRDITRCSKICAVLLAPGFHPLISEPRLFNELNAATKRHWADIPVCFETAEITAYPENGDFRFSDDGLTN